MSEEKDQATAAAEAAAMAAGQSDGGVEEIEGVPPQISVTPGMPVRQGVLRRQARVREILHTLPPAAQEAIREDLVRTEAESARIYAQNAVPEYGN
jgi:phospholipid/cholesterol/gamma-HCH transport system ATP-binding protein